MRCVIVGLVCVAGCNAVFGLDPTKPYEDAGPPSEGPTLDAPNFRPILLTKLVVTSSLVGGVPTVKVDRDLPLDVDPQVRIALLADDSMLAMESRVYMGNAIEIPVEYPGRAWRMVAMLDGRSHEYQWRANEGAHITTNPSFGHQAPAEVPIGSKWSITPNNVAISKQWTDVRFFTSGVWTESHRATANPNPSSSTFVFDFNTVTQPASPILVSQPLVGPFGAPDSAGAGDWQVLVELAARDPNGCIKTLGSTYQQVDLTAGGESVSTPRWNTATTSPKTVQIEGETLRFTDAILDARDPAPAAPRVLNVYGFAPNGGVPAFNRRKVPDPLTVDLAIDRPVMVTLVECEPKQDIIPPHVDVPELLPSMTRTYYAQITESRTVTNGPVLITSVQAAIQPGTVDPSTRLNLAAPLGRQAKLDTADLGLSPDDAITFALPSVPRMLTLTWGTEPLNNVVLGADAWEVTLHYIDGITLVPVRTFHVTEPSVKVESSLFDTTLYPARRFIFELKSLKGVPNAGAGDYTQLTYPYSTATVFTWAFKVTP